MSCPRKPPQETESFAKPKGDRMNIIKYFTQPRQVTIGEFWIGVLCVFILAGTMAQGTAEYIRERAEERINQKIKILDIQYKKYSTPHVHSEGNVGYTGRQIYKK